MYDVPKLEVLAALQRQLQLSLAGNTFQSQDDLLRRLSLLVEHGLGLTTVTRLLAVVTTLTLREGRGLARLCEREKINVRILSFLSSHFPVLPLSVSLPFSSFSSSIFSLQFPL